MVYGSAELQCTSHFSFLRGASSCEQLFAQAASYGYEALAITDRNSLAGIVRAHQAAKDTNIRLIVGCRLDLKDGASILVYPTDKAAYSRLCRLLSTGKSRAGKGACALTWGDVEQYAKGLIGILVPDEADETCSIFLRRFSRIFESNGFLALSLRRRAGEALRLHDLATLAAKHRVKTVATGDVLYHIPSWRIMQDVVTCIRLGCTIDELGFRRERTADRYLLHPEDKARLFNAYPEALARASEIANRCRFSLNELAYQYPKEVVTPGMTPQESLRELAWEGARNRYPGGIPRDVIQQINHELQLIAKLNYAPYFLTVNSIVQYARSQDILCQGRGSAANSAVCYALGITSIDPTRHNLLFERFISQERDEPPDIDVDFEHERREQVIQWVYNTYGRQRAAICSTVIRYRSKGALRDVGKALGLTEDIIKGLSSQVWGWSVEGVDTKHAEALNLNVKDRRLRLTLALAKSLIGTPRHLSQHVGGFVLTHDRLDELVPIEPAAMQDRQVIEWDKDDIDIVKFMKVDCLALGMLSCMKRAFNLLKDSKDVDVNLATIPAEDPATYSMIQKADTLGVFQIESRAQMAMLPRTRPQTYYDLVVQVAIVRPGPIQGGMVHPYLRRKSGQEKVEYPSPIFEKLLKKTLGVPLFQEQAMQVAIECAGFTPGEADQLRRSMATWKFTGGVSHFEEKLIGGMVERGYKRDFAERMFRQLEGFGSYGFPESHAASFALLAYASSWLKCHHPDVFCAALLNAQPMGFYAPAQIVRDAQEHGVEIRPVCINASRWDCTLEPTNGKYCAVRLGFRQVKGFSNDAAAKLVAARMDIPYASAEEAWRRAQILASSLLALAEADSFLPAFKQSRREALWTIKPLRDKPLPLFEAADAREQYFMPEIIEPVTSLKPMTAGREVVEDYHHIGFTLRQHPVGFIRENLRQQLIIPCAEANVLQNGSSVRTAGMVLVRQRPGSAKGVMFITIEDNTGSCNLVIWPSLYEGQKRIIHSASLLGMKGKVQREGEVVHLVAHELYDLSAELAMIAGLNSPITLPVSQGDYGPIRSSLGDLPQELHRPSDIYIPDSHPDTIKVKARDFK